MSRPSKPVLMPRHVVDLTGSPNSDSDHELAAPSRQHELQQEELLNRIGSLKLSDPEPHAPIAKWSIEFAKAPETEKQAVQISTHLIREHGQSSSVKPRPSESHVQSRETNAVSANGEITLEDKGQAYCLPVNIAGNLYPHQREGICWLWKLHVRRTGGILGDDMGLGKTRQISAFLAGLFLSQLIKRALIVAPKTLIAHWIKELSAVDLGGRTRDYSGSVLSVRNAALHHVLRFGGVLVTTYDIVRVNWKTLKGESTGEGQCESNISWDYVILDEGHLIKNHNTERARSLREIPSSHRIILSGTPIQNNLREMWALFDFCCPHLFGDWREFKQQYENPIHHGNDKTASERVQRVGTAAAENLRKQIAPFFLRRMKSEVFPDTDATSRKLPLKNDLIVWLRLSKFQQQLYRAFLKSEAVRSALEGASNALAAITVLKKICDHPLLLSKRATDDITEGLEDMMSGKDRATAKEMAGTLADLVDLDEGARGSHIVSSCKIDFLVSLLEDLVGHGHRTLVFSQTRKMLDIIQEEISQKHYRFLRIDGTMKASDREQNVQEFQSDPSIVVLLLTSQVGGLGLTLTAANRVIIVDPNWNPSVDNQSVDRAYRIGQTKDVLVYRLISCSTIEEIVYKKQVFKGGLMKVATEKKETFRYFSQKDLHEIFSVPSCGFDISLTQQQLHEEHDNQYCVTEQIQQQIQFLHKLPMMAGVSHHDRLFTKTAPAPKQPPRPEKKVLDPKEFELQEAARQSAYKVGHLKGNIKRLARTLEDQALIDRLPDKGLSIVRKLKELSLELTAAETKASQFSSVKVK